MMIVVNIVSAAPVLYSLRTADPPCTDTAYQSRPSGTPYDGSPAVYIGSSALYLRPLYRRSHALRAFAYQQSLPQRYFSRELSATSRKFRPTHSRKAPLRNSLFLRPDRFRLMPVSSPSRHGSGQALEDVRSQRARLPRCLCELSSPRTLSCAANT